MTPYDLSCSTTDDYRNYPGILDVARQRHYLVRRRFKWRYPMELVLTATNGTMTLAHLGGITLLQGTGVGDTRMVLLAPLSELNLALDGLSFQPTGPNGQIAIYFSDLNAGAGRHGHELLHH